MYVSTNHHQRLFTRMTHLLIWHVQKKLKSVTREGVEHAEKGNFEKALICFDKALSMEPNCVHTMTHKGKTMIKLGKYQDAMALFNQALEIDPNFADALEAKNLLIVQTL